LLGFIFGFASVYLWFLVFILHVVDLLTQFSTLAKWLAGKTLSQNDLLCAEWDIRLSLTQSLSNY